MTRKKLENELRAEMDRQAYKSPQVAIALQIAPTSVRAFKRGAWSLGDDKLKLLAKFLGFKIVVDWQLEKIEKIEKA